MKLIYKLTWFLLTVLVFMPVLSFSQVELGGLYLTGKITTEQGKVGNAIIKMTRDGKPLADYSVGNDGLFNLRFEFSHKYELIFTRVDNFSQKVVITTVVPTDVLRRDRKFPPFPLDINLFTEIMGIDRTFSENAIMQIFYSPQVDNFIPEVYYNNPQIKRLIDQAIWQSQNVNRESDLLKRLSAAELAELKKEYAEYIKKAGLEFDKGEYINALGGYKSASRIFPAEQFPKDRIAEINDLIAVLGLQAELEKQMAAKYAQFIIEADRKFQVKEYKPAKENYNQALLTRPNDVYATSQIAVIDRLVEQLQASAKYTDVIALADNAFNEKLWDQSKVRYQEAQKLKPDESYPASQIARIDATLQNLSQMAEKQANFEAAVVNGDASYVKQFYSKAIAFYETALTYKPGDPGVTAKIAKIEREQKIISDKLFYDTTIADADKAFNKKEYSQATALYKTAMTARPDQPYPQRQLLAIENIFKKQAEYEKLIASGNAGFEQNEYQKARDDYRDALAIIPGESYPAQQIKLIDSILANQSKDDQKYRQLIAGADKLFNENKLPEARSEYQKAASQRPADTYPSEMLAKISEIEAEKSRLILAQQASEQQRLLSEQQQRDLKYKEFVDQADALVNSNELIAAVGKFRAALEVKPQESYPLRRIEEIRGIIAKQTEKQKVYDAAISSADKAFNSQQYAGARTGYQQAQQAKPDEKYPAEMLSKIDGIEAESARISAEKKAAEEAVRLAAMNEKERQYTEAIARADGFFNQKQYVGAITDYRNALKIKPDENYPKQKITESEKLLSDLAAAQKAYDAAIALADKAFKSEQYAGARAGYLQAQQAKSDEKYPAEMLAKIDGIEANLARISAEKKAAEEALRLAAMNEKERQYSEAITRADGFFNQKQYPGAITDYRNALKIKPYENYPKQKITEGEKLLADLAAAQKAYDTAIALADKAYNTQQYAGARAGYLQAQQAKSDEKYPAEMLAKINGIEAELARLAAEKKAAEEAARLAAMNEKERQYTEAIARADGFFNQKQYVGAITDYRNALKIKPYENYPKQKITEGEKLLADLAASQKAYDAAITLADKAFKSEQYAGARAGYLQAQQAKSDEKYPAEMLSKIDGIEAELARLSAEKKAAEEAARLAAMNEKDQKYGNAIKIADQAFAGKLFDNAENGYREALKVKPEEKYPADQIVRIGELRAAALQEQFNNLLIAGDDALKKDDFTVAEKNYRDAGRIFPNDARVSDKLAQIDRLRKEKQAEIAAADNRNREYSRLITLADRSFGIQQYVQAVSNYKTASEIKPEESHPKNRIAEIENILKAREADEQYRKILLAADIAFRTSDWTPARENYVKASEIKPGEDYPQKQIQKIDETLQRLAQKNQVAVTTTQNQPAREVVKTQEPTVSRERVITDANEALYKSLIEAADAAFNGKEYNVSRAWYFKALEIKVGEPHPTGRIDEINRLLANMQLSQRDREFQEYIDKGDLAFRQKEWAVSRSWYNRAVGLKSTDAYPKSQLVEIQQKINENLQGGTDSNYKEFLSLGDKAFAQKQYNVARVWYQRAQQLKPAESLPREKLEAIRMAISE